MRTIVKHPDPGGIAKHFGSHAEVTDHGSIRVFADGYDDHGPIAIYGKGTWAEVTVIADPKTQEEPVPDESDKIRSEVMRARQLGWAAQLDRAATLLRINSRESAQAIIEEVAHQIRPIR